MTRFYEQIGAVPPVFNADKAEHDFRDLMDRIDGDPGLQDFARLLADVPLVTALLKSVFSSSIYLTGLILREPGATLNILQAETDGAIDRVIEAFHRSLAQAVTFDEAMSRLRRFKRRIALFTALMDIACIWRVDETTRALSLGAEAALQGAVRFLFVQVAERGDYRLADLQCPECVSGYIVLGLGKLGGYELNYSSDIDLIVFFEPGKVSLKDGLEPQQFFVRLTRDLVKLMQERTGDGYVFRTDLRLRPDPGATQVALSTHAGLIYYEAFGQNWERAAMIKARAVAGDLEAGQAFLEELSPFVWRKYLDFAAIADVHAMKRQIHAVKGHGSIAVKGHNIKLGRGGIREIEFFAQTQQLIAGGRQPDLRCRGTLAALGHLVDNGWIEKDVIGELSGAYLFLRHVEHRLQMIADEQTHSLPSDEEGLLRIARFSGFEDFEGFASTLRGHLETVQGHYGSLFEDVPELASETGNLVFVGDEEDPETIETLSKMGFPKPSQVIEIVRGWHFGRYPATRSEKARERLTELQPKLLARLADTAQPDVALIAFDRFLKDLPTGIQLFSLLRNNPSLLRLMADIMGTAPRLARVLGQRANLLDAVLDPGFFGDLPSDEQLRELVDGAIGACGHYQDCLDLARSVGQEQSFLIGVRVLSGTVTAAQAGGAYAHLAEHLIEALQVKVAQEMAQVHGVVRGGEAVVLAMGKLGGEEMTAGSDLDLIVIFDFDEERAQSDGEKPLEGRQYYARFTQRLISALTAPTAQGTLYEVDMRLRPSGNAGPVATWFRSFEDYQESKAWTWEHMALTRARVLCGSGPLRAKIDSVIDGVLRKARDKASIAADIVVMRSRISDAKGGDALWNLKHVRGGLVDLEFLAQYLQLIHAHDHPEVLEKNTLRVFMKLRDLGLLPFEQAEVLIPATQLYHNLTQILRLCLEGVFSPETAPYGLKALLVQASGEVDFERLEILLADSEQAVARLYDEIIVAGSGAAIG